MPEGGGNHARQLDLITTEQPTGITTEQPTGITTEQPTGYDPRGGALDARHVDVSRVRRCYQDPRSGTELLVAAPPGRRPAA